LLFDTEEDKSEKIRRGLKKITLANFEEIPQHDKKNKNEKKILD
jgi:hypothetical protein